MRLQRLREVPAALAQFVVMWVDAMIRERALDANDATRAKLASECESQLPAKLCDSSREIFLLENAGEFIGFTEVTQEERCFPDEDLPESCVRIQLFYITPECRSEERATAFFKLVRSWGRANRAALVEVTLPYVCPKAEEFLSRQGLELVGSGQETLWRGFI